MRPASKLSERDRDILRDLWRYRYATSAQLSRLHFSHQKLAQRRLRILTARGLVDWFQPDTAPQRGFGMWWYRLARAGARVVAADQGHDVEAVLPPRRHPRAMGSLAHHAQVNEFRIWLREGCTTNGGRFGYEYIPGYEEIRAQGRRQRRIALAVPGHRRLLIPDGACTLTHQEKRALFLLEVDRGTEPLSGRHPSAIERKFRMYRDAFDAGAEEHYARLFQAPLVGFRVLCIVPDTQRQRGFLDVAARLDMAPLVWVTTIDIVRKPGDLTARCWAVTPDGPLHALTE